MSLEKIVLGWGDCIFFALGERGICPQLGVMHHRRHASPTTRAMFRYRRDRNRARMDLRSHVRRGGHEHGNEGCENGEPGTPSWGSHGWRSSSQRGRPTETGGHGRTDHIRRQIATGADAAELSECATTGARRLAPPPQRWDVGPRPQRRKIAVPTPRPSSARFACVGLSVLVTLNAGDAFAQSDACLAKAEQLGGYDLSGLARIHFNGA